MWVSHFYLGWAIHGLAPLSENRFNGIGLTVLFRDLAIPLGYLALIGMEKIKMIHGYYL